MGYFQTPWHIVLLLLIALLLFGGKRLPEMGRALGSGMREFKDAVTSHEEPEQPRLLRLEEEQRPPDEPTTAAPPTTSEHKTD
jgi:sec-independent protein translocase protein TatA